MTQAYTTRAERKAWVYRGHGSEPDVGLVRKKGKTWLKEGDTIVLLGDDIGEGLLLPLRGLIKDAGLEVVSEARAGRGVAFWGRSGAVEAMRQAYPDPLVLVGLRTFVDKTDLYALAELVRKLKGLRIVWIEPPRPPGVKQSQPKREDLFPWTIEPSRAEDGLTPSTIGYAAWAGELWTWLK